jgi:hypothetical protein
MKDWTEDELEKFIKENKDKFEVVPRPEMEHSFLKKLKKIIISIVPHLIKVGIFIVVIWSMSFSLWYFFDMPTLWGLFWNWIR